MGQFNFVITATLMACAVAWPSGAADDADQRDQKQPSAALRKSLIGKEWTVELSERQFPPNHGTAKIIAGHDGKLTLYRSRSRTLPDKPERVSDLTDEQRNHLLDLAVEARGALAFNLPLHEIEDASDVDLRLECGRRTIKLSLHGSDCETNKALKTRLQKLGDAAAPGVVHIDGRDYGRKEIKPGPSPVCGKWQLEVRAGDDIQRRIVLILKSDGYLRILNDDMQSAKDANRPDPYSSISLDPQDRDKLVEIALQALNDFNFGHDAKRREEGMSVSIKLTASVRDDIDRVLLVRETGLRRDELAKSLIAPIVEFVNSKLPEVKRVSLD